MQPDSGNSLIGLIRDRVGAHRPVEDRTDQARAAAVAIVLRAEANDVAVLFIKRADYALDPWSGQVAFPGGRQEVGDADLVETAFRETHEEIGVDLRAHAQLLGQLDDLHSRNVELPNVFVRPFVLAVNDLPPFQLSREVAEAFWVPLSHLRSERSWRETTVTARGLIFQVRACDFGGRIIWGMTERIVSQLLDLTQ